MAENQTYWAEKYRPKSLGDYVLDPEIKKYFESMVANRSCQNLTFAGPAGSGKTTLARILAKEFGAETLFVKCATEGTVDVLRTRIQEFCNAMTWDGKPKVVVLDELDSASSGSTNNFQMGLRTVIEAAADDTFFLCTCNYAAKIIPAVLSRCPVIPLKYSKQDLLQRVKLILDAEKVKYGREGLKAFIEEAFGFYPDCRRIVNYLQFCCASGELVVTLGKAADSGRKAFLDELVEKALSGADLLDVRRYYLANKDKVPDFVAAGSDLFNAAVDGGLVDDDGVLRLSDMLFQLNQVIDKEAGFFGMVAALRRHARRRG